MSNDNAEYIDVMLDLETLGVRPGCKILQIAACTFNLPLNTPRHFFNVYTARHLQAGLWEDPETVKWWMEQQATVRDNLFGNPDSKPLAHALLDFQIWLESLGAKVRLWGNGVRFDNAILEYAYKTYDIELPWNTKYERCYRTLKAICGTLVKEPEFLGNKHDALDDVVNQAIYAELMLTCIMPYTYGPKDEPR